MSEWQIKTSIFLNSSFIDKSTWCLLLDVVKFLLASRDRLWGLLKRTRYHSSTLFILAFDETGFVVQWTWFVKTLDSFIAQTESSCTYFCLQSSTHMKILNNLIQSMHNALFNTHDLNLCSDILWKKGGHPTLPSSAYHFEGILVIREILQTFSPITEESFGYICASSGDNKILTLDSLVDKKHPLLYVPDKLKFETLAALCTTFSKFTNETGKKRDNEEFDDLTNFYLSLLADMFQKRINQDQAVFKESMEAATMDVSINTPENKFHLEELEKLRDIVKGKVASQDSNFACMLLEKWGITQLSQIAEAWCIVEELEFIGAISSILSFQSILQFANLAPRISNWIQVVLSQTIWAPDDVRSFQTLLWACESISSFTKKDF